jgi:hypothetical protein
MIHPVHDDLKRAYKAAGLKMRDLSIVLNELPGTTAARLNGYLALSYAQSRILVEFISAKKQEVEGRVI